MLLSIADAGAKESQLHRALLDTDHTKARISSLTVVANKSGSLTAVEARLPGWAS